MQQASLRASSGRVGFTTHAASLRAGRLSHRRQLAARMVVQAIQGPPVMVNSCTGKVGHAAAEAVLRAGLTLVPYTFTSQSEAVALSNVGVSGVPVQLVGPEERMRCLEKAREQYPGFITVDYTLPAIVNSNARFYCEQQLPFVMGTTGGDREALLRDVAASGNYAVIAPNMGKQIVAFQTMMEMMAETFPGCFSGYTLEVVESHQKTKVDTSGTAKAVVASLNKMGLPFDESQIELVRDPEAQVKRMGVPESALNGHAFHTYTVTSPDGSVQLQFQHNVVGREVYAEGTVDAAIFLAQKVAEKADKRLYNMIDVLKAGAMRAP